ncbi:HTH domain protein [Botrimarina colliarenosi]|uniref:HTH domain protein n=1 Tax=Botrimarina colliarenosi TaxID=2528001 RepID=A0A5C6A7V7_9BACT|nr:HTH domain-containing protein [Botrimarina colliarenosi]TWT95405.1 HTH domain protein [Botrimarina colliarenosi]
MSTRLSRLLVLQRALAGRTSARVSDLEQELGVSRRTIYRDLRTLRNSGVEVRFDAASRGHTSHDAETQQLPDAASLFVLLRHAMATALPVGPAERRLAEAAAEALAGRLSATQREELEDFRRRVTAPAAAISGPYAEMLATFERAVAGDRCLEVFAGLPPGTLPQWQVVQPLRIGYDLTKGWRLEGLLVDSHLTCRIGLGAIRSLLVSERPITMRLARAKVEWTRADIEVV